MIIHEINHPSSPLIWNGDFLTENNFVFIDAKSRIYRNGNEVNFKIKAEWPLIRIVSDELFLLVDYLYNGENNAWLVNNDGNIINSFYIGEPTTITVIENKIFAAYSKCSLDTSRIFSNTDDFSTEPFDRRDINGEGFAIFDFQGNYLFSYMNQTIKEHFIPLIEVEAFLQKDKTTVYLLADSFDGDFNILELNLENYVLNKVLNVEELGGKDQIVKAMTKKNDNWYFIMNDYNLYSTYNENPSSDKLKSEIFKLDKNGGFEKIGECCFSNRPHGNYDGSFTVPLATKNKYEKSCFIIF